MSTRDSAIAALASVLAAALATPGPAVPVVREPVDPQRVPAQGMVQISEGQSRAETPILSPLAWQIEHEAQLVVLAPGNTDSARRALADALLGRVHTALTSNRTLSGAVEFCNPGAASFEEIVATEDGLALGQPVRAASVQVLLEYTVTGSPLG